MRTSLTLTTLSAAVLLAVATAAQAGGGAYMGGGGGRGMSGGGFGGGGMGRGMSAGGPAMSMPSAGWNGGSGGPRNATGGGRGNWNGGNGWHGGGHGGHGGHGHGHGHGYWYGGWYYPYWYWPAWGATIAVATTWPYWSGYYVDPYYYPGYTPYAPPTYQYYGPGSGTIIYRDQPGAPQGAPQQQPQQQPYRLYCPATNQYYPDVSECSQQWLKVVPNDGAAPPPTPGARPTPQSLPVYPGTEPKSKDSSASAAPARYVLTRASTTIPAPRSTLPGAGAGTILVAESYTP